MDKEGVRQMMEYLTGKKFNRWTVLSFSHKNKHRENFWNCVCECGVHKVVSGNMLKGNHSKSCGCLQKEIAANKKKHGMYKSKLYHVWAGMKQRCQNRNSKSYANYGGRSITVCKEWNDPIGFMNWALSHGYKEGLQLDRKNNSNGYTPENCRFITPRENESNRRNNVLLTVENQTKTLSEWTRLKGYKKDLIASRLKLGWTAEDAVLTPLQSNTEGVKK